MRPEARESDGCHRVATECRGGQAAEHDEADEQQMDEDDEVGEYQIEQVIHPEPLIRPEFKRFEQVIQEIQLVPQGRSAYACSVCNWQRSID